MARSPLGPPSLVYAHRGDRSRAPDNTLEAFALADEAGADGIELDVRRTADDVLVMMHDPSLEGLPPVCEMPFADLRAAAPQVPTLIETLAAVPSHVYLNVEIKNHPFEPGYDARGDLARAAVQAIVEHDDPARIVFSSFDPVTVGHIVETGVDADIGFLIDEGLPIPDGIALAHELGVAALHPPFVSLADAPDEHVRLIHDAGLAVVTWNADNRDQIVAAATASIDVIITDEPGLAREIVDAY